MQPRLHLHRFARSRTGTGALAAAAAALGALALVAAPEPAAADHVHSGRLLHPEAARTRILVREAGHRFHAAPVHGWHGPVGFGHRHHAGPGHHHHPGCGHAIRPWRHGHRHHDVVVAPGFFCNRCHLHFDHRRAFRHHAWHHHGIGRRHLRRIAVHIDGVTILF